MTDKLHTLCCSEYHQHVAPQCCSPRCWCQTTLADTALFLVSDEFKSASAKHKPMNSHHEAKAVIEEEFDEYWDLVKLNPNKQMVHPTKGYLLTPQMRNEEMREELVQMAAMCLRALHDLCEL